MAKIILTDFEVQVASKLKRISALHNNNINQNEKKKGRKYFNYFKENHLKKYKFQTK